MKKILLFISMLCLSSYVYAEKGEVIRENVCGSSNYIIETSDGWYVALEHWSGSYLSTGDIVFGNLKSYGFQEITKKNGNNSKVYIEDYETSIGRALEELCD